jgi:two-component system sensor kinase FixL
VIGMLHIFLWRREVSRDFYLFSAVMAIAAGSGALTELALAKTHALADVQILLKLGNVTIGVTIVAMTWFLHRYLQTGRRFLLWAITGLWACGLVVNFFSPWSLTFADVTSLREMTTFWGETYHLILGSGNLFKILPDLASLLVAVFAIDASVQAWRSGRRRQAGLTGGAISFFIIAAGIHTPLVDAGLVKTPYLISVAFVGIVAALNYELVLNAAQASQRARVIAAGHQRWNSLLKNVQLAVVDLDREGRIRFANPFFLTRTGYPKNDIKDLHISELIPSEQRREFLERLQQGLAGSPRPASRWPILSATGPILTFDWNTVGLRTVDGQPDGVLSIGAEVTDQVRTEKELDQTRNALDRVNRANVLGEFVSAIAHELNQPLTAVLANAQVARRYLTAAPPRVTDTQEMLDLIIRDDKRAAEVIRKLHGLVARGKVERESLDLNDVIRETVELCDRDIRDRGVRVTLDLDPDLVPVQAGRIEFQQIVLNLLLNALQALEEVAGGKRRIVLGTRAHADGTRFSIEDSGPGLPATAVEWLFTPFGEGREGGVGLGLAICRRIIEAHGGTIRAEQVARGGARFTVEFPLHQPQEIVSDG